MNLILFGPPGAGKGTQAQSIVKNHNYFQLSTGDLLRDEIKNKTQLGGEIDRIIAKGDFVSDEIVNTLLKKSITNLKFRDRIIFDGYPRNTLQAENLNKILLEFKQKIDDLIQQKQIPPKNGIPKPGFLFSDLLVIAFVFNPRIFFYMITIFKRAGFYLAYLLTNMRSR